MANILKGQMETHEGDVLYPKTTWDMIEGAPNITPAPNLLCNADFRSGIINQEGKSTYQGTNSYSIDGWVLSDKNDLTIGDGYVRIQVREAVPFLLLQQFVKLSKDKTYTLTFKAKASTPIKFECYESGRYLTIGTSWQTQSITFEGTDISEGDWDNAERRLGHMPVYIGGKDPTNPNVGNIPAGAYIDFEFAKLEEGSVFTGMPLWNEAIELLKCRKYFYRFSDMWQTNLMARSDSSNILIYVPLHTPMAYKPSLVSLNGNSGQAMTVQGFNYTNFQGINFDKISVYTNDNLFAILSVPISGFQQFGNGIVTCTTDLALDSRIY